MTRKKLRINQATSLIIVAAKVVGAASDGDGGLKNPECVATEEELLPNMHAFEDQHGGGGRSDDGRARDDGAWHRAGGFCSTK